MVIFDDEIEAGLVLFQMDRPDVGGRNEAIRYLLRDHLIGLGYIELPPAKEDAN